MKDIDYTIWRDNYQERAAILEHDAADVYPTKELAERAAMRQVQQEFVDYYKLPYYGDKVSQGAIIGTNNKINKLTRNIR